MATKFSPSFPVLILITILLTPSISFSQNNQIRFEHITSKDGLSSVAVETIIQDSQGFIWIGTFNGLNKHDGKTITTYTYDPDDPESLGDSRIWSLFEDRDGILWVGTKNGGLNRYNREADSFMRYEHDPEDVTSISSNFVRDITQGPSGAIWVGTYDGGLNKMDPKTGSFQRYRADQSDPESLVNDGVRAIHFDQSGHLWVGTFEGLSVLNTATGKFINLLKNPSDPESENINNVYAFSEDKSGNIWVGTGIGISKYDKNRNYYKTYKYEPQSQGLNIIYSLLEDSSGNLWASVWGKGLCKFDRSTGVFTTFSHNVQDINSIGAGSVTEIYEDRSKVLWVGTSIGGLSLYKPQYSDFIHHNYKGNEKGISAGAVSSIYENGYGGVWAANVNGIVEYIPPTGTIRSYNTFKKGNVDYHPSIIYDVLEDSNSALWIGSARGIYRLNKTNGIFYHQNIITKGSLTPLQNTYVVFEDTHGLIWLGSNIGLVQYSPIKGESAVFQHDPNNSETISDNSIRVIYEDHLGLLWVGTDNGLNRMNDDGTFTKFPHNPTDSVSISNDYITNIYEDKANNLWVGTDYGLNLFKREERTFEAFTTKQGLPSNLIYAVLEDNRNNLWVSTNKDLTKFDINSQRFKIYNNGNGVPINEFYINSFSKSKGGQMYFGGTNGIVEFHPDSIFTNKQKPAIALTDFKLFNQSVQVKSHNSNSSESFVIDKNINLLDTIRLSYLENVFSFEFAALDYVAPNNNQYAYKLDGFNEDWIYTTSENRIASYTNLDPGSYTFQVIGSNNDEVWNEEGVSIVIIVSPPWWKTEFAYFIYSLSFLGILFAFIQWRASRLKNEKVALTRLVETKTQDLTSKNLELDSKNLQLESQAKKLIELDDLKARFFANISHEFRTPLTLILGLINKQIASPESPPVVKDGETMKRNANRLLQLINQLLELSKLESDEIIVEACKDDISHFTRRIVLLFESLASGKALQLAFNGLSLFEHHTIEPIEIYFDPEKLQKILTNLVSNAIKFTPENGEVNVDVSTDHENVTICVSNSGEGIPPVDLPYVFDRFYQVNGANTTEYDGTGIGLALVKELIELHEGTISVDSTDDLTSFVLTLQVDDSYLSEEQKADPPLWEDQSKSIGSQIDLRGSPSNFGIKEVDKETIADQLEILIIEDNPDLRVFIKSILEPNYKVYQAVDGLDGLQKAEETIPDLIVSDVMMPNMDGYELCKRLKSNKKTNHIPVVLLTAKASHENKMEGLETGADDYLIKPFEEDELKVRIKNLITIREQLQQKYQQEVWLKPKEIKVDSVHQKFLEKIKEVIEVNIDNSQFSVDDLGGEIAMSRSQVHRKLKALTDQSATNFIRNYRLHRAAELLKQESGNVTEIAYQVGFSSQTYFSSCFQELFLCSPSEYIKRDKIS